MILLLLSGCTKIFAVPDIEEINMMLKTKKKRPGAIGGSIAALAALLMIGGRAQAQTQPEPDDAAATLAAERATAPVAATSDFETRGGVPFGIALTQIVPPAGYDPYPEPKGVSPDALVELYPASGSGASKVGFVKGDGTIEVLEAFAGEMITHYDGKNNCVSGVFNPSGAVKGGPSPGPNAKAFTRPKMARTKDSVADENKATALRKVYEPNFQIGSNIQAVALDCMAVGLDDQQTVTWQGNIPTARFQVPISTVAAPWTSWVNDFSANGAWSIGYWNTRTATTQKSLPVTWMRASLPSAYPGKDQASLAFPSFRGRFSPNPNIPGSLVSQSGVNSSGVVAVNVYNPSNGSRKAYRQLPTTGALEYLGEGWTTGVFDNGAILGVIAPTPTKGEKQKKEIKLIEGKGGPGAIGQVVVWYPGFTDPIPVENIVGPSAEGPFDWAFGVAGGTTMYLGNSAGKKFRGVFSD